LIVRENTEDLYVGEEQSDGDTATAIKRITRAASRRVAETAFRLAQDGGRHRVTIVHKANIMPLTDGLFRDAARDVARTADRGGQLLVDTAALKPRRRRKVSTCCWRPISATSCPIWRRRSAAGWGGSVAGRAGGDCRAGAARRRISPVAALPTGGGAAVAGVAAATGGRSQR
jgi:hypothetical protein